MKLYFKNRVYKGETAFINGNNGYTRTKDDGYLCAVINKSCWNEQKIPNYITDKDGKKINVPQPAHQFNN